MRNAHIFLVSNEIQYERRTLVTPLQAGTTLAR